MRYSNFAYMNRLSTFGIMSHFGIMSKINSLADTVGDTTLWVTKHSKYAALKDRERKLTSRYIVNNMTGNMLGSRYRENLVDIASKMDEFNQEFLPYKKLRRKLGYGVIAGGTALSAGLGYGRYKLDQIEEERRNRNPQWKEFIVRQLYKE